MRTERGTDTSEFYDSDDPVPTPMAWGAQVARTMASLGFMPKQALHPSHVEYAKAYADAEGRTARVTALIAKGVEGVEPSRLEAFILTVQVHIPATLDAVERAPAFLRQDLATLVSGLGDDGNAERAVVAVDCARCGERTPEFAVSPADGRAYCPSCRRR